MCVCVLVNVFFMQIDIVGSVCRLSSLPLPTSPSHRQRPLIEFFYEKLTPHQFSIEINVPQPQTHTHTHTRRI